MKDASKDIVGKCCARDNQGHIALTDDAKKKACRDHCNHLLNVEFPWYFKTFHMLCCERPSNFYYI